MSLVTVEYVAVKLAIYLDKLSRKSIIIERHMKKEI